MSPSQYAGYDPRFVTEWVRVRIPKSVTGLFRYHHSTPPPVSRWIGERMRYLLLWQACELLLLRQAGRRAVLLARWIVRSVPLEIVGSSGHEKVPTRGKPGLERPGRPRGERIVRQALVDPTVTHLTIRADVGVAIVPQTVSRHLAEANLKFKRPFRTLPLTPEHRQLPLQWSQARSKWNVTDWQKVVFSDESRFVLGTDDNCVWLWRRPARVAQDFLRHFQTLPWPARSPDLSPVEHVWDHLKRQMPSCHFVHDLELTVQDLWAHLPQDNIRCLFNLMPDRVVACIAAGGGPTRY
ncbi:transposable element Tcb2 transposase [Trichonephila clavipes]|nr:transposable element Tcb2 transposase [Trichonephila clavipes]